MRRIYVLILSVVFILVSLPVMADSGVVASLRNGTTVSCSFKYDTTDYSIGFNIIDEVSKTVRAEGFVAWPQKQFVLTIPQTVQYNGNSYTVTQIANYAFCCASTSDAYKSYMQGINFPDTITTIGKDAFKYNSGLLTISSGGSEGRLPASLSTLGTSAFKSCSALEIDLVIPGTLSEIPTEAFRDSKKIKSITIESGVQKISGNAFYNVEKVSSLVLPKTLTEVNMTAFTRMKGLSELHFTQNDVTFSGTADTSVWKYPEYTNISSYGGCMGGTYCKTGYTKFYVYNAALLNKLKTTITTPINTGNTEETQKCKDYFLANNFTLIDRTVKITSPENNSEVGVLPITVTGTAAAGNSLRIYSNSVLCGTVEADETGNWSCVIQNAEDGYLTISAFLSDNNTDEPDAEVKVFINTQTENPYNAEIESGKLQYFKYNAVCVGGIEWYDTFCLTNNQGWLDTYYTQNNSKTDIPTKSSSPLTDGNSEFSFKNRLELDPTKGEVVLDIKLNDSYLGGRNIEDLFLYMEKSKESADTVCTTKISFSTKETPGNFKPIYTWSEQLSAEEAYFYLRLSGFKQDIDDVDTLRFTINYNGTKPLYIDEIDANDKEDHSTISSKKQTNCEKITPHKLITDNMVLQRNENSIISGTGGVEGATLTVSVNNQIKTTTVKDNKWQVTLDPMTAGGPYDMTISCPGVSTLTVKNIMVGEVWLAGGQSNMALTVQRFLNDIKSDSYLPPYCSSDEERVKVKAEQLENIENDIANSSDDYLRLFQVESTDISVPYDKVRSGKWGVAAPETILSYSATGYYFGRELRKMLGQNIPVGIVISAHSGSGAERWVSEEVIKSQPEYAQYLGTNECTFYNGMIYPLKDINFKGVIFYQGEANVAESVAYEKLFPDLIQNWRDTFDYQNMPFIFTNLAPFSGNWNNLREVQLKTMLNVNNTAMAVITDGGHWEDIHPKDKSQVGYRLAAAANAKAYGSQDEYSGPLYKSMTRKENKLVLEFEHKGTGMVIGAGQDELRGFEISSDGKNFVPAKANIVNDTVEIYADGIEAPVDMRYGWKVDGTDINDPIPATLYNKEGFPAVPFRAKLNGFAINKVTLFDSDGIEITDGIIDTDKLYLKVDYTNQGSIGTPFVVALYYDGILSSLKTYPNRFNYKNDCSENLSLDIDTTKNNPNIKIMVLNDFKTLRPITKSWSLTE